MYYLLDNKILEESEITILDNGEYWNRINRCDYFFTDMGGNYKGIFRRVEDNQNNYNTLICRCESIDDLKHSENILDLINSGDLVRYYSYNLNKNITQEIVDIYKDLDSIKLLSNNLIKLTEVDYLFKPNASFTNYSKAFDFKVIKH